MSRPTGLLDLPAELLTEIGTNVVDGSDGYQGHTGTKTLKACRLTCKTLAFHFRPFILHTVTLQNVSRLQTLYDILSGNKDFRYLVKAVTIRILSWHHSPLTHAAVFPEFLQLLTNVRSVVISGVDFTGSSNSAVPEASLDAIIDLCTQPTVRQLKFFRCTSLPPNIPFHPSLNDITIQNTSFRLEDIKDDEEHLDWGNSKNLKLSFLSNSQLQIAPLLRSPHRRLFGHVHKLSVEVTGGSPHGFLAIEEVIRMCSRSGRLRDLDLSFNSQESLRAPIIDSAKLDLTGATDLRAFRFAYSRSTVPGVWRSLKMLHKMFSSVERWNALQTVIIELDVGMIDPIGPLIQSDMGWEELDRMLSDGKAFPALESVRVEFQLHHDGLYMPELKEAGVE
ncbi:hypothetical protein CC1G_06672 [Coprinopsis cinerea okayama7|uniref:F-box domain-containing protein n=1 Tax=Coprinopsis cinerea (strain Okayama-7 / 130 / ATCC MYA-4618 / FGSC 9003) TaxID=240176 RepID=A8P7Z0_COPC7|nr:hypothetical protein CC1G_06672 [Coprinopsis cinerea okayama7\|eukprot:XP_001839459.2 hypothetical protein CC1G_06672 [Coprinopsis cinerea okayama7\